MAHSGTEGEFAVRQTREQPAPPREGELRATLASRYPYVRGALHEQVAVWGVLGVGRGSMAQIDGATAESGSGMLMGALGVRAALLTAAQGGGLGLTLKADGCLLRMTAQEMAALPAVEADVSRVRLVAEGSANVGLGAGRELTPSLEAGVRYDAGQVETGAGVELGGGLRFADPAWGLRLEATARGLLAHEDPGSRESGAGGALQPLHSATKPRSLRPTPVCGVARSVTLAHRAG